MELIGNKDILAQINIATKSAFEDNRSIPHILMSGAAGCGKTSTAKYIAHATGGKFISVACDALKTRSDLLQIVDEFDRTGWDEYGDKIKKEGSCIAQNIVFMDEIHGLSLPGQEHLGILMEEWYVMVTRREIIADPSDKFSSLYNSGSGAERMRWSPAFTLIGATTNDGKLSKPFRDRFKMRFVFSPYSEEESVQIAIVHAKRLGIDMDDEAPIEIAKRGRGIPRVIVTLLERCRDMAIALNEGQVTYELVLVTFRELHIDDTGLNSTDIDILKMLYEIEEPIGLDNLAVRLNESPKVLSEAIEPYLIQRGFLLRGSKGRKITDEGRRYLIDNRHIKAAMRRNYVDIPRNYKRRM